MVRTSTCLSSKAEQQQDAWEDLTPISCRMVLDDKDESVFVTVGTTKFEALIRCEGIKGPNIVSLQLTPTPSSYHGPTGSLGS